MKPLNIEEKELYYEIAIKRKSLQDSRYSHASGTSQVPASAGQRVFWYVTLAERDL